MSAALVRAWLIGWQLGLGLSLGCLVVLMLHQLVDGRWNRPILPLLEGGARSLPVWALGLIPIALGTEAVYPWTGVEFQDATYLHTRGFVVRSVVTLSIWSGLALALTRAPRRRRQGLSAVGLIAVFISGTVSTIDWLSSLDPGFSSSMFGLYVLITRVVAALCIVVVLAVRRGELEPELAHDLGTLLLSATLLWAYISFSQFLLVWSADLPGQAAWYLARNHGPWLALICVVAGVSLLIAIPALLMRAVKRHPARLASVAALLLVAHLLELYWLVLPAAPLADAALPVFGWLDAVIPAAVAAAWVALTRALSRWPTHNQEHSRHV
ncbi:hypothetical protein [Enhygromyxa salina]|uniref:Quinol:cytochrome c oxidoreductase quinone-binding subunit 2 n=1 Tax=Enhygromyxa salina TaxID=215803 RepID=A0A2S9YPA0_9BACT|nr:hypothetical protein [Enhygromyxa salina]PRQ06917.1 hypothetical protein ENSA7_33410 [Enhygromyxa salina]